MLSIRVLLIPFIIGLKSVACNEYKTIETINGSVRGRQNTTLLNNVPYYSFKGIPYAKPPVGDLRFKAPEPVKSWKPTTFNALEHSNMCTQPGNFMPVSFPQSEDCLSLNIFVPANKNPDEKLAVLFFIHGGGYVEGASNDFYNGNDFITERNVILVTINYRLGVFGFLSLNTPEYSGNMGLKDQQMALKWVSENIERFGGDSKRITIFGHSAGGASVNFHILSAESRKYFRNAFCMSGSVENYWAMAKSNDHLDMAHKMVEDLNCEPHETFDDLIKCLHSIEAGKFNPYNIIELALGTIEITAPVIERRDAKQPFLVDSPQKIYDTAEIGVNAMFSFTSLETLGTIFLPGLYPTLKQLDAHFDLKLPFRGLNLQPDSENYRNLTNQIRQFYFGNDAIDEKVLSQYVALFSDINFAYGIDKATKLHASKSNGKTFYYRFSVDSKLNIFKRNNSIYISGASHGDEHCYLFRCGMAESIYDEIISNKNDEQSQISLRTIESMTKIVTNFAKYGEPSYLNDPVGGYQPIQNDAVHFLDITNRGLIPGLSPNTKANDFWTRINQQASEN